MESPPHLPNPSPSSTAQWLIILYPWLHWVLKQSNNGSDIEWRMNQHMCSIRQLPVMNLTTSSNTTISESIRNSTQPPRLLQLHNPTISHKKTRLRCNIWPNWSFHNPPLGWDCPPLSNGKLVRTRRGGCIYQMVIWIGTDLELDYQAIENKTIYIRWEDHW